MADPHVRYNELISLLKERGYRLTPQRMALLRLIAASEGHPGAAQLYEQISEQFPSMSPATVYKTLAMLKDMGQVLEVDLHGDSRYDGNRPYPHPHLICTRCGHITDGELQLDQAVIQNLENQSGYRITSPRLSFYGLCPDCLVNRD